MSASLEMLEWRADLQARAEPSREWMEYVRGAGISMPAVYAHCGLLALARCRFIAGQRFDWSGEDGELAAVIEVVEVERGEPVTKDLVAWSIDEPSRFGTAMGTASILGGDQLRNPASFFPDQPLPVWRTPLAWVTAGCRGVVLLDEVSGPRRLAGALGKLLAEDLEHAREIDRLCHPWLDRKRLLLPLPRTRGAA